MKFDLHSIRIYEYYYFSAVQSIFYFISPILYPPCAISLVKPPNSGCECVLSGNPRRKRVRSWGEVSLNARCVFFSFSSFFENRLGVVSADLLACASCKQSPCVVHINVLHNVFLYLGSSLKYFCKLKKRELKKK